MSRRHPPLNPFPKGRGAQKRFIALPYYDSRFTIYELWTLNLFDSFCLALRTRTKKFMGLRFCYSASAEKMFAVVALEPSHGVVLSFKCTPEKFAELV